MAICLTELCDMAWTLYLDLSHIEMSCPYCSHCQPISNSGCHLAIHYSQNHQLNPYNPHQLDCLQNLGHVKRKGHFRCHTKRKMGHVRYAHPRRMGYLRYMYMLIVLSHVPQSGNMGGAGVCFHAKIFND